MNFRFSSKNFTAYKKFGDDDNLSMDSMKTTITEIENCSTPNNIFKSKRTYCERPDILNASIMENKRRQPLFKENLNSYRDEILRKSKFSSGSDGNDEEQPLLNESATVEPSLRRRQSVSNVGNNFYFDDTVEGFDSFDEEEIEAQFKDICSGLTIADLEQSHRYITEVTFNLSEVAADSETESETETESYNDSEEKCAPQIMLTDEDTMFDDDNNNNNNKDDNNNNEKTSSFNDRIQFFNNLALKSNCNKTDGGRFLNLLKSAKDVGKATLSKTQLAPINSPKMDLDNDSSKTPTRSQVAYRHITPVRKSLFLRRKTSPMENSSPLLPKKTPSRTKPSMCALMEDLSLVLPVKLRIAEFERRIAAEKSP